MPTHPVRGHSFVPLPTPSPLLGSCDHAGSPLITVDPAAHSEALIYFANIVNSDIASKIAISLIILCVALASGVLPMRVIARAHHQEEHHHYHGEAAGGNRIHRFLHAMVKYGNSFSAGVFLAMGIVHLMPEASRAFTAVYGERYVERYHPGELFVLIGYVLILALHRVVFPTPTCPHALEGGDSHSHSHGHGHSHDDGEEPQHSHSTSSHRHQRHHHVRVSRGNSPPPPPPLGPPTSADPDVECRELLNMALKVAATYGATDLQTATASRPPPQTVTTASANLSRTSVSRQTVCCRSAKHCVDVAQHGGGGGGSVTSGMSPLIPLLSPFPIEKNGSFEAHSINSENNNKDYYGGGGGGDDEGTTGGVDHLLLDRTERIANAGGHSMGWTLVVALSVHAICEGLALGLQCGPQNVLMLGCAICSHKWAESFALSSSLIHQAVAPHHHDDDESSEHHEDGDHYQTRAAALEEEMAIQRAWKIVVLFALATPVGALLGGVMHSKLPPASAGVVKALSAGTFMYIGASEVVVEEFVQGRQYWGKWICLVSGVGVMYGLNLLFH